MVESYCYTTSCEYTVKAKATDDGWVVNAGGRQAFDESYSNPATINIPVNTSVDLPFTYNAANITVSNGESNSGLINVAKTSEKVCESVDNEAKKVYEKTVVTCTINAAIDKEDAAACISNVSASNGVTATRDISARDCPNGLTVTVGTA